LWLDRDVNLTFGQQWGWRKLIGSAPLSSCWGFDSRFGLSLWKLCLAQELSNKSGLLLSGNTSQGSQGPPCWLKTRTGALECADTAVECERVVTIGHWRVAQQGLWSTMAAGLQPLHNCFALALSVNCRLLGRPA
jgi:hypothetical protein